jgi:hypothetical protein
LSGSSAASGQRRSHCAACRRFGGRGRLVPAEKMQVVDQRNPIPRGDRADLVDAVGIKCGEADLGRLLGMRVEHHLASEMPHDQLAAAMGRGQDDRQCGKHPGKLFRVAVVDEKAAGVIDEQLVEIRRHRFADAETAGGVADERGQALLPMAPADANPAGFDLPGSPAAAIDDRLLSPSKGSRFPDRDQPLDLHRQEREGDPADVVHIDRGHDDFAGPADAEIARPLDRTQAVEKGGTDRGHGSSGRGGDAMAGKAVGETIHGARRPPQPRRTARRHECTFPRAHPPTRRRLPPELRHRIEQGLNSVCRRLAGVPRGCGPRVHAVESRQRRDSISRRLAVRRPRRLRVARAQV